MHAEVTVTAETTARRTPAYRVGAAERERALDLLGAATGAQYLTLAEFSERAAAVAAARTDADLHAALHDLPPDWIRRREALHRRRRLAGLARLGVRLHLAAYLAGSLLMVGIWLAVGLTADAWYPWPVWPVLGWGLGVAGHAVPVGLAVRRTLDTTATG